MRQAIVSPRGHARLSSTGELVGPSPPVRWRLGSHTIAIAADIGVEIVVVEAAGQTEPTGAR
jgi:hypothetical protein